MVSVDREDQAMHQEGLIAHLCQPAEQRRRTFLSSLHRAASDAWSGEASRLVSTTGLGVAVRFFRVKVEGERHL
jgi:hypothetical protein